MSTHAVSRKPVGASWFFILFSVVFLIWSLTFRETFTWLTTTVWYLTLLMGYIKLFLLGTCGEVLKSKNSAGSLHVDNIWQKALVWGLYGVWFTLAFPFFSHGLQGLINGGIWFPLNVLETDPASIVWVKNIGRAISTSLWINLFGGYAWSMMVSHEYCNFLIKHGWGVWGFPDFALEADNKVLIGYLWKLIFVFWVPAHTVTYMLPPEWRVLMAAVLAVVLGYTLTYAKKKATQSA